VPQSPAPSAGPRCRTIPSAWGSRTWVTQIRRPRFSTPTFSTIADLPTDQNCTPSCAHTNPGQAAHCTSDFGFETCAYSGSRGGGHLYTLWVTLEATGGLRDEGFVHLCAGRALQCDAARLIRNLTRKPERRIVHVSPVDFGLTF
jgi:hypothetical protein